MPDFLTVNPAAARGLASRAALPLVRATTEEVAMRARLLAPGSMKDQIRAVTLPGAVPRGLVISDHPKTQLVLFGTKKHDIKPKKGKFLVFTPKNGGGKVFARIVHHPGTKPNNFLLKALNSI